MIKVCASCAKEHEIPKNFSLGSCNRCGKSGAIAEVEYRPPVIEDLNSIFGSFSKPSDKFDK